MLLLSPGKNHVVFVAEDAAGNQAEDEVDVFFETVAKDFTANQRFGEHADSYDKFWGTGRPGSKVTAVSEFGSNSVVVAESGEWFMKVHFDAPAGVAFPVRVSSSDGGSKTFEFVWRPVIKDFTANQVYGSCDEDPPFDVFHGTGAPGMVVEIGSSYGSGRVGVDETGRWELKVFFPDAPLGETFEVVLETTEGHRKVFGFTRTAKDL